MHFFPDKIAARAWTSWLRVSGLLPVPTAYACGGGGKNGGKRRKPGRWLLSIATAPEAAGGYKQNAVSLLADTSGLFLLAACIVFPPSWREQLIMLKESRGKGIKLHPDYQGAL